MLQTIVCVIRFCFILFSQIRSYNGAQAGHELWILLPQPPVCWDSRCTSPFSVSRSDFSTAGCALTSEVCEEYLAHDIMTATSLGKGR